MTNYEPMIFCANADEFPDPAEDKSTLAGIPQKRRDHILNYKFSKDRKLSLCAWRLLENVLEKFGHSTEEIYYGKYGKPLCRGINFNLSHSAEMAVCGVGASELGVDVEKCENAPFDICDNVFTDPERNYIESACDEKDKTRRFFRLWTAKESFMKMKGMGLTVSPKNIEINVTDMTVSYRGEVQNCGYFSHSLGTYEMAAVVSCPFTV